jgi:hypothetical protein
VASDYTSVKKSIASGLHEVFFDWPRSRTSLKLIHTAHWRMFSLNY